MSKAGVTTPHPDGGGELVLITLSSFPLQKTPAQIRAVLLVQPARCHLTVQQSQPRRRVHNRSGLSVCLACECTSACSRIFSSWSTEAVRLHSDCTAAVEITPTAMAGDKERCLGSNASESAGLCRWSSSWRFFARVPKPKAKTIRLEGLMCRIASGMSTASEPTNPTCEV